MVNKPQAAADGNFAAIDLGSNSFHLIVARHEQGTLHVIDRIKEMVRLAEGVDGKGRLDPAVAKRALDCLARFGQRVAGIAPARIAVAGTNTLRRLSDAWPFLARMEEALGHPIEIISGEDEARLIYLGVAHGITAKGKRRLVIDIGGGSTELALGRRFRAFRVDSLFFGCVAVSQRFFGNGKLTAKRWRKARSAVAVELQRIAGSYQAKGWHEALGSSGTMKAVRNVVVAQGWSERGITPAAMDRLRRAAIKAGRVDQLRFEGLSERRRPVFAGGAAIVDACLQVLAIDRIQVTDYALREGLLYDLIGRRKQADQRRVTVNALKRRYRVENAQSERVRATALALFDRADGAWALPEGARGWLEIAATVHEIGLTISHHGYHRHGAYLLENSDLPGFSRREQLVVAILVRNHRRRPQPVSFAALPEDLRPAIKRLCVLLRLAALLCRSRAGEVVVPARVALADDELTIAFPKRWRATNPLTAEDLDQERAHLTRLGVRLKLALEP